MSLITGDGTTYPASFEAPDDGDDRDAAAILVGLEALADRTEHLKDRIIDGTSGVTTLELTVVGDALIGDDLTVNDNATITGNLTVGGEVLGGLDIIGGNLTVDGAIEGAGDITAAGDVEAAGYHLPAARTVTVAIDAPADAMNGWEPDFDLPSDFSWITTVASTLGRPLRFALNAFIPRNANITQIVATYQAASGHANLPDTMPLMVLYRKRIGTSGAASASVGSVSDGDTNGVDTVPEYEAEHDITLTIGGSGHTADTSTAVYYVLFFSEADAGADAIVGAKLHGLKVTYTYTRVDKT
jgi:hypothetical protein